MKKSNKFYFLLPLIRFFGSFSCAKDISDPKPIQAKSSSLVRWHHFGPDNLSCIALLLNAALFELLDKAYRRFLDGNRKPVESYFGMME
ncbi:MAG: hypothetical protein AAFX93_13825 [Verrucomicrobiota bacterium]